MISTKDLDVFYNENKVLKDIQLEVKPGKITGIIGPNGAGKSTLIKAILNIVPHSGKILINGKVSKKELKNIAYVEQVILIILFQLKLRSAYLLVLIRD